ncbi:hypothetical protein AKJ09_09009 [Labilithrix luteola]|uniref:PEGA domain-containing protein n=1 Tax=Labilithrix luteola TaxID=1391654 RepID=A0A0K1Q975_9BACT|nr:hypothetical protein AKJ09_09009 [Labilithrix luteola]
MAFSGAAFAAATLFAGAPAHAADDREVCASAADQAQQLRDEGKYRRAREQMLICARDVCPAPIKRDCLEWLSSLEQVAPTIVISAKDGTGDVTDVKVSMDGTSITERLDGKPFPVDLGEHTFKFEYQGKTKEEKVLIGAGQKVRTIGVQFGNPNAGTTGGDSSGGATAGGEQKSGSLVPALVVGGIGVLALGSWAYFGLSGTSDVDHLESTCKPNCKQSDVDSARSKLIIADVSLGVGVVALGVATYMILTRPKVDSEIKTGMNSVRFDFGPTRGGAVAGLGGNF